MGRRPIAFARILGGGISQEGRALKSPPFWTLKNALIEYKPLVTLYGELTKGLNKHESASSERIQKIISRSGRSSVECRATRADIPRRPDLDCEIGRSASRLC